MNFTQEKDLLTRKDVASLLDVSDDFVRRNEVTLGLDKAKVKIGRKLVRYRRRAVEAVLAGAGILPRPPR